MKMNKQLIKVRLQELGLEIGEVYHETWDREANMGYLYLTEERMTGATFGGNEELGTENGNLPEFVLDIDKEGTLRGVEVFFPAGRYIDAETKSFGFDLRSDEDDKEFKKALKTLKKIWNKQN